MPHFLDRTPARARMALSASAVGLLTAGLAISPAAADEACDGLAASSAEFEAELACASAATDGEQVITITDDFTVPVDAEHVYEGTQPLLVTAAPGTTVSGSEPDPEQQQPEVIGGAFLAVVTALEGPDAQAVTVENLTLEQFGATGVIWVDSEAQLRAIDLVVRDNGGADGGLIGENPIVPGASGALTSRGDIYVEGSTFTNNAGMFGGAITSADTFIEGQEGATPASVEVVDSTFTGNTAMLGAAVVAVGQLSITGSTFTENSGALASTIIAGESLALRDSTVAHNDSTGQADAEVSEGFTVGLLGASSPDAVGALDIVNTTFAHNTDVAGTVAVSTDGAVSIAHTTFVGNETDAEGAQLLVEGASATTVHATVFDTATAPACAVLGESVESVQTSYVFDDGSCTDGWSGIGDLGDGLDPQLGALAANGGPTLTSAPLAGSPLIDAIPADALSVDADQRGIARPQGGAGDIGAIEVESTTAGLVEFQVKTDAGTIHGTAEAAIDVTGIAWIPVQDLPAAPPADTMFPYGAAGFTVGVPAPGDSVTITLTAPRPFTSALKSGADGWSAIEGATFNDDGTMVTYTLTDGGALDEDGEANGQIVDPVALAVQATFTG